MQSWVVRDRIPSRFSHFRFNKFSIYLDPRPRWLCARCRWDSATIAKLNLWWITHPEEKGNRSLIFCRFYRRKLNKSHSRIKQKFTVSLNKIIGLQTSSSSFLFSRLVRIRNSSCCCCKYDNNLKLCTQVWVQPIRQHNSQALLCKIPQLQFILIVRQHTTTITATYFKFHFKVINLKMTKYWLLCWLL